MTDPIERLMIINFGKVLDTITRHVFAEVQ